jgi:hypothetical protein
MKSLIPLLINHDVGNGVSENLTIKVSDPKVIQQSRVPWLRGGTGVVRRTSGN